MTDILWTIISTWIIWKLWSFFASSKNMNPHKNEHHEFTEKKHSTPSYDFNYAKRRTIFNAQDGEYVEFEEIIKNPENR